MVRPSLSARSLRVSIWILLAGLAALLLPAPLRAAGGQEYVDKKAGFRMQVPAGWEKLKIQGMSVAFRGPKTAVTVTAEMADISPEEYIAATKRNAPGNLTKFRPLSEEEAVVGGLPARKLANRWEQNNAVFRGWVFVVLSKGEYWILTVVGGDAVWPAEGSPEEAEVLGVIASFEFLEPTLSRLKAGVPPDLMASLPKPGANIRYFVNDAVGMKILLQPGWEIAEEQEGGYGKPASVNLGKPGTLAYVSLRREVLEASQEVYWTMIKNGIASALEEVRWLPEDKVTVGGLSGLRVVLDAKQKGVWYRSWVQVLTSGKDHYVVEAGAPKEIFDAYKATFEQVLNSTRFPAVERASPSGQAAAVASATAPNAAGSGASAAPGSELEQLKRAIEINPNDVEAHVNLGNLLDDSGNRPAAIEEYRTALRLDANRAQAHRNLGIAYWRDGKLKEAEKEEREAIRLKPDYKAARATLVEVLLARKNYDGAFVALLEALQLDRNYAVELTRGSLLKVEQADFDRASVDAVAHLTIGMSLWKKDLDRAAKELQAAIQADPQFALAHQVLASLYGEEKNDLAAGTAEAQAALRLNPKLPNAHIILGNLATKQNQYEAAAGEFQAAIQLAPDLAKAYLNLSDAYFHLRKLTPALGTLVKLLAVDPKFEASLVHQRLFLLYSLRGDFPLAWHHAQEAQRSGAQLDPQRLQRLAGKYPESKYKELLEKAERLRQAVRKDSGNAQGHVELGDALCDIGEFDGSEAEYQKALNLNSNLAAAHNGLGRLAYRKGDSGGATGHWQESLRLEPAQAEAHFRLGRMYAQEPETRQEAAPHFEEFLRRVDRGTWPAEEVADAYASLGDIYSGEKVGREKDALQKYEEGLKYYPEDAGLLNETAWLYATAKEEKLRSPQKALAYALKAVKNSNEQNAAYLDTLAEAYFVNGEYQKAMATEEKAVPVGLDPDWFKKTMERYKNASRNKKP